MCFGCRERACGLEAGEMKPGGIRAHDPQISVSEWLAGTQKILHGGTSEGKATNHRVVRAGRHGPTMGMQGRGDKGLGGAGQGNR